jgi:hypothetical protein
VHAGGRLNRPVTERPVPNQTCGPDEVLAVSVIADSVVCCCTYSSAAAGTAAVWTALQTAAASMDCVC